MPAKILKVDSVELQILESSPPQLIINAGGTVSTPGWTNGQLIPWDFGSPKDGIYDFDFVADAPTGIVLQVLMPISTSLHLASIPQDMKGVRVHASSGSVESFLNESADKLELPEQPSQVEVLRSLELTKDELKFRVRSGGCTQKEHFKVDINKGVTGLPPFQLTIFRIVPDNCRALVPEGELISFTRKELEIEGMARFIVTNEIGDSI